METVAIMNDEEASIREVVCFGPFRLHPQQRKLYEGSRQVSIGSRAMDILLALVENPGQLIGKHALLARVWSGVVVEEGVLRVHMSALRKALGDSRSVARYLESVSGRGYRFIAQISRAPERQPSPASLASPEPASHTEVMADHPTDKLPVRLSHMIGRSQVVDLLAKQLPERRFMTILGSGGVGKTTVALAVAERLYSAYPHGVRFVDLASITDPALLPGTLATALGLAVLSDNPLHTAIAFLKQRSVLIVLDNCEHVIDAAAHLAEQVLKGASRVHLLATSREALRAEGECLYRLAPLKSPPASMTLSAARALHYSAIQLFFERATSSVSNFEMHDADVPAIAQICRELDGNALAIELAVARVDVFTVHELAARLTDRFRLLTRGRRTSLPRHQTLRATLDWSYNLLPECEQLLLRRLSVFAGSFDVESIHAVAADDNVRGSVAIEYLINLAAKSLFAVEAAGKQTLYRLLDTPRAYAREKLEMDPEHAEIRRRHALLCCSWGGEQHDLQARDTAHYLATSARRIDDIRAALNWCFAAQGDALLGVKLIALSGTLWFELSLLDEYRDHVERALRTLQTLGSYDLTLELELHAGLADALHHTKGPLFAVLAYERVIQIGNQLGIASSHRRVVSSLWNRSFVAGEFSSALAVAETYCNVSDEQASTIGQDMMMAMSHHMAGQQCIARRHTQRLLNRSPKELTRLGNLAFQFDIRVGASTVRARSLWIEGFPDQAIQATHDCLAVALSAGHISTFCYGVTGVCAVPIWTGDTALAKHMLTLLIDNADKHTLLTWKMWARGFDTVLSLRECGARDELSLDLLPEAPPSVTYCDHLVTFNEALLGAQSFSRAMQNHAPWCAAEIFRAKGELLLKAANASGAEAMFHRSLELSRQRAERSWELRTAMSLARLWRTQNRAEAAYDLLASVYAGFGEGFATRDLQQARTLLSELTA